MTWYGWLWQRNAWHRVTGPHDSLSECSHSLGRIGEARGVRGVHQVMTGGGPPQFIPSSGVAQEKRSATKTTPEPSFELEGI